MPAKPTWPALDLFFKSHPWHGIAIGPTAPARVTVHVETGAVLGPILAQVAR